MERLIVGEGDLVSVVVVDDVLYVSFDIECYFIYYSILFMFGRLF